MRRFDRSSVIRLLIISLLIITISISSIGNKSMSINNINWSKTLEVDTGSFSVVNTTESNYLFEDHIWGISIGATWNVSIRVHSNSTTGIFVTFISLDPNDWTGIKDFQVHPGQTFTNNYTQHGMSDNVPYFNFNYILVESMKNASGTYNFTLVHSGYHSEYRTGSIFVSNITEWLLKKQSSNSSSHSTGTTSSHGTAFGSWLITILLVVYYLGKRKMFIK